MWAKSDGLVRAVKERAPQLQAGYIVMNETQQVGCGSGCSLGLWGGCSLEMGLSPPQPRMDAQCRSAAAAATQCLWAFPNLKMPSQLFILAQARAAGMQRLLRLPQAEVVGLHHLMAEPALVQQARYVLCPWVKGAEQHKGSKQAGPSMGTHSGRALRQATAIPAFLNCVCLWVSVSLLH